MTAFRLARFFGNHMVLQRQRPVRISGFADQSCRITVDFDGMVAAIDAGIGPFTVMLPPHDAATDLTMTVSACGQTEVLRHIACGEVWIAGGQSNMAMILAGTEEYQANPMLVDQPDVRLLTVGRNALSRPADYGSGYEWAACQDSPWICCGGEATRFFSAVGYYFALALHETLDVPVGIISCNVGGSRLASWMPISVIAANPDLVGHPCYRVPDHLAGDRKAEAAFHRYLEPWREQALAAGNMSGMPSEIPVVYYDEPGPFAFNRPGGLFDSMLRDVLEWPVRGMIWYQGESDALVQAADVYLSAMRSFFDFLQQTVGREDTVAKASPPVDSDPERSSVPFQLHMVQLATWDQQQTCQWDDIRQAQLELHRERPQIGLVSLTDLGSCAEIHPPDKRPVGLRLAETALRQTYGINRIQGETA